MPLARRVPRKIFRVSATDVGGSRKNFGQGSITMSISGVFICIRWFGLHHFTYWVRWWCCPPPCMHPRSARLRTSPWSPVELGPRPWVWTFVLWVTRVWSFVTLTPKTKPNPPQQTFAREGLVAAEWVSSVCGATPKTGADRDPVIVGSNPGRAR